MKNLRFCKTSTLPQQQLFHISTDIANFHLILPKYFKSLKIIKDEPNEKIVLEKISFLGFVVQVKTRHVIIPTNIHKVYILTGPLKGTSFIEFYNSTQNGTEIIIDLNIKFFGILKVFNFLKGYVVNQMMIVMDEFICSAENKISSNGSNLIS